MAIHSSVAQRKNYSEDIKQNCPLKIILPNFYGIQFNIYTNSNKLLGAINRFLCFFLDKTFRDYLDFYFPKFTRVHNVAFHVQKEDPESIFHLLGSLEKEMRQILCEDFYILHAAAIAMKNAYLFFMGDSYTGKSSLALNFKGNGSNLYSDDIALLKKDDLSCLIFPHFIKIRRGILCAEQSALIKKLKIEELSLKKVIDLTDFEFESCADYLKNLYRIQNDYKEFKPKEFYFIFLNGNIAQKPNIYEMDKPEAILCFLKNTYLDSCLGRKRDLIELIFKSKCYALEKGPPEDTRKLVLSYLQIK